MWLFLETTRPDASTVALLGSQKPRVSTIRGKSHVILAECIRRVRHTSLKGICVVSGPGSFTSTRTGVLIANILSRMLRLPLVAVTLEEAQDLIRLTQRLANGLPSVSYVAPVYSSEPNITKPK